VLGLSPALPAATASQ